PWRSPSRAWTKDPKAEKERLKRLEEARDAKLASDLFAGFEKPETLLEKEKREKAEKAEAERKAKAKPQVVTVDEFDNLELNLSADVETLLSKCMDKFETATLAKGGPCRFLSNLIKGLETTLDIKDLAELEKSMEQVVKDKKAQKGANLSKDNKANTKLTKTTKFDKDSEWQDIYGGGEDDEDWTEEEWNAWYAEQEKKGGAAAGAKW
ncbi:unnamed protein product, partial [Effrenium voratum]